MMKLLFTWFKYEGVYFPGAKHTRYSCFLPPPPTSPGVIDRKLSFSCLPQQVRRETVVVVCSNKITTQQVPVSFVVL